MRPLLANEILEVWEAGKGRHPIDKALTLLSVGCPKKNQEDLATLCIGRRDALLFALREIIFGPRLDAFSECPACHEKLEFSLDTKDLLADNMPSDDSEITLEIEGFKVRFHLPTSIDLATSINQGVSESHKSLLEECIIQAGRNDMEVALKDLPETVTSALVSKMRECDPLSEIKLDLNCPACRHRWPMILDIVSFLWTELDAQAKIILHQVHILARSYGWREADILSMNSRRRQYYINMVTA